MKLFRINSLATLFRALLGWPMLMIGLFMLAALIGSHIAANPGWKPSPDGVDIFVETNGVHVSLIVPMSAAGEDLSDLIRPEHLQNRDLFGTHAMIGWGHGPVYRNAQTWADVRIADLASAVIGSDDTTLHVYHLIAPEAQSFRKPIRVSQGQFRQIIRQIRATFRLDENGRSVAHPAYAPDNLFYDSHGRYSAVSTCNNWTADVLKQAGVRVGIWTPFPGGVMRWF